MSNQVLLSLDALQLLLKSLQVTLKVLSLDFSGWFSYLNWILNVLFVLLTVLLVVFEIIVNDCSLRLLETHRVDDPIGVKVELVDDFGGLLSILVCFLASPHKVSVVLNSNHGAVESIDFHALLVLVDT